MYPNPMFVSTIGLGTLHIMGKPSGGENLRDDISILSRNGYSLIVSLLEADESYDVELNQQESLCSEQSLAFHSFPIKDRSVPQELSPFLDSVEFIFGQISNGAKTIVHCRAGIGRSGIYSVALLIRSGLNASDAFALVSKARGLTIPDTQIQIDWIHANEAALSHAT